MSSARVGLVLLTLSLCLSACESETGIIEAEDGSVTGKVAWPNGNGIPGVTVVVHNDALSLNRTDQTDADGDYLISGLPSGSYRIFAQHDSEVVVGDTATINVVQTDRDYDLQLRVIRVGLDVGRSSSMRNFCDESGGVLTERNLTMIYTSREDLALLRSSLNEDGSPANPLAVRVDTLAPQIEEEQIGARMITDEMPWDIDQLLRISNDILQGGGCNQNTVNPSAPSQAKEVWDWVDANSTPIGISGTWESDGDVMFNMSDLIAAETTPYMLIFLLENWGGDETLWLRFKYAGYEWPYLPVTYTN